MALWSIPIPYFDSPWTLDLALETRPWFWWAVIVRSCVSRVASTGKAIAARVVCHWSDWGIDEPKWISNWMLIWLMMDMMDYLQHVSSSSSQSLTDWCSWVCYSKAGCSMSIWRCRWAQSFVSSRRALEKCDGLTPFYCCLSNFDSVTLKLLSDTDCPFEWMLQTYLFLVSGLGFGLLLGSPLNLILAFYCYFNRRSLRFLVVL